MKSTREKDALAELGEGLVYFVPEKTCFQFALDLDAEGAWAPPLAYLSLATVVRVRVVGRKVHLDERGWILLGQSVGDLDSVGAFVRDGAPLWSLLLWIVSRRVATGWCTRKS